MRIIIDADACPKTVKNICIDFSDRLKIELIMVIDTAHELSGNYTVIVVEKGKDSVDHKIVSIVKKEDVIITQDYGLASMILANVKSVIHPDGFEYTKYNIDMLMYQRHMAQKIRNSGGKTKGPKKRDLELDKKFIKCLESKLCR